MNRRLMQQLKDFVKTFIRPVNLISIPQVVEKPPGNKVIVFSPHFDDDIIGCGGTLHKHVLAGNQVSVIYFTDGREGDPSFHDKGLLEKMRKEESRNALAILGMKNIICLDEPETNLCVNSILVKRLQEIFNEIKPDILYIPSFLENHIDHFEVNRILLKLSKKLRFNFNIAAYEVWTPLIPNMIVDITMFASKKEEALRQFKTQIKQVDYVSTAMALNRYRSVILSKGQGYSEVFLYASLREYTDIIRKLRLNKRLFIKNKSD